MTVHLVLVIAAAIFFLLASVNATGKVNLVAAGLLAWLLSTIF